MRRLTTTIGAYAWQIENDREPEPCTLPDRDLREVNFSFFCEKLRNLGVAEFEELVAQFVRAAEVKAAHG